MAMSTEKRKGSRQTAVFRQNAVVKVADFRRCWVKRIARANPS
ncbi:MAG: hypothetical protein PHE17_03315 [Thiothrix sp.]|nr:hypothetical protein [Thiothrix sp.]MDD5392029.1 hypothetical protein [Thiothrix sp.]